MVTGPKLFSPERRLGDWALRNHRRRNSPRLQQYGPEAIRLQGAWLFSYPSIFLIIGGLVLGLIGRDWVAALGWLVFVIGLALLALGGIRMFQGYQAGRAFQSQAGDSDSA